MSYTVNPKLLWYCYHYILIIVIIDSLRTAIDCQRMFIVLQRIVTCYQNTSLNQSLLLQHHFSASVLHNFPRLSRCKTLSNIEKKNNLIWHRCRKFATLAEQPVGNYAIFIRKLSDINGICWYSINQIKLGAREGAQGERERERKLFCKANIYIFD